MAAPISIGDLKFQAALSTRKREGRLYKQATLSYFVERHGQRTTLVDIVLDDTEPYAADEPLRFWFHYQPLRQFFPLRGDSGKTAGNKADRALSMIRDYPAIDLIVFSSVLVKVRRNTAAMRDFEMIGFEGVSDSPDIRMTLYAGKTVLSPARPKIALRRVHRACQIPLQGTPFDIQSIQPDYSFYAVSAERTYFTMRPIPTGPTEDGSITNENERRIALHTWTRIFFDTEFTEFHFQESSYRLRVYDQGYDMIDGQVVNNEELSDERGRSLNLEDARRRQDSAEELISLPKRFSYRFEFDDSKISLDQRTHGWLSGAEGVVASRYAARKNLSHRTRLVIEKSDNVFLIGTISRTVVDDMRTNVLLVRDVPYDPERGPDLQDYRDYLPSIALADRRGISAIADLEQTNPEIAYLFQKSAYRRYLEFQLSVFLGLTPIVGEAFGLYELYTACSRSEDAFGNRLTDNEKILVAIAAILPLVNLQMVRSASGMLVDLREAIASAFPFMNRSLHEEQAALRKLASP